MKNIKKFNVFVTENYVISPDSLVSTLLNNMVQRVKKSFDGENDVFGEDELSVLSLIDIERSTVNDSTEKNIILNFEDTEYYYQVTFIIMPFSSKEKDTYSGYIKIKLYDLDTTENLISEGFDISIKQTDDGVQVKEESESQTQVQAPAQEQAPQGQSQGQEPAQESTNYDKYNKIYEAQEEVAGYVLFEKYIIEKIGILKEKIQKKEEV